MRGAVTLCLSGYLVTTLVACSGVGSATAPLHAPPGTPATGGTVTAVVSDYYRAVAARDYERAFGYLARQATGPDGQTLTLQAYLQLTGGFDAESGPVTTFTITASPSLVVVTINRQRAGPYHAHLRVARAGKGWVIVAIDRI